MEINQAKIAFGFFHDDKFMDDIELCAEYLHKLDVDGFDVHVYGNVNNSNLDPRQFLHMVCENTGGKLTNTCYLFLTDMPELCDLFYKMYYNFISAFVLFNRRNASYEIIDRMINHLRCYIPPTGVFRKPIYTDYNKIEESSNIKHIGNNWRVDLSLLFSSIDNACDKNNGNYISYQYKNKKYLYEPFIGKHDLFNVLNDIVAMEENASINLLYDIYNTETVYPIDISRFSELIKYTDQFNESPDAYYINERHIERVTDKIITFLYSVCEIEYIGYIIYFELLANSYTGHAKIMLLSFLINAVREIKYKTYYMEMLLNIIINDTRLNKEEKHFLFWQINRIQFVNANVSNDNISCLFRILYRQIYQNFLHVYKNELNFIPKENRNKKFILILTGNIVTFEHGPTKTTFDRAESIARKLEMDVLVVNTKEVLTILGRVPFYNSIYGNVVHENDQMNMFKYLNTEIPFHQLKGLMPNDIGLHWLIDLVKKEKPYIIITIGGCSISNDILSNLAPTVCQTLGPSALTITEGQFQVIGRERKEHELKLINTFGFTEEHIISTQFTWNNLKPQTMILSRVDLNLPVDKFLIIVVGARLSDEIKDEFIDVLVSTIHAGTHFVFAGSFEKYTYFSDKNDIFAKNSTSLGFQSDMLAVCDTCDLYVNPNRAGGGFSAVEALFKGLPVVTLDYGDVALATSNEFFVNNYDEMREQIIRYARDKHYYNIMSKKAKKRAALLMDTDQSMVEIFHKTTSSPLFK